jgi:hypothetical protein
VPAAEWWILSELAAPAFSAALSHRLVIFAFAVSATAGLLAAMMNCINGGPGTTFGFVFRYATLLVTLFDVTGLAFLFVCVFVLVTSWHFIPP